MNKNILEMQKIVNEMKNKTKTDFSQNPMQNLVNAFNPNTMQKQTKRTLISQNISSYNSAKGVFKKFQRYEHESYPYIPFESTKINNVCNVQVIHSHALDVAKDYAECIEDKFTLTNKYNPVVLNVVGKDFSGSSYESNDEIRDEIINLRTTFCVTPEKPNIFPIRENHCVYTKLVLVIRPKNLHLDREFLGFYNEKNPDRPSLYRTSIITTCPIKQDTLQEMNSEDFIKTCTTIECVFQTAISNSNQCLILTPFGDNKNDNILPSDIIKLYNFCIMKYGHKIKNIIVAIPPHYEKHEFELYNKNIIRPNELCKEIDEKYENIILEQRRKIELKNKLNDDDDLENSYDDSDEPKIDPAQFELIMKMMKQNPDLLKKIK
jgi:hypothetical protein